MAFLRRAWCRLVGHREVLYPSAWGQYGQAQGGIRGVPSGCLRCGAPSWKVHADRVKTGRYS